MNRIFTAIALAITLCSAPVVNASTIDSIAIAPPPAGYRFEWKQMIAPCALLATGVALSFNQPNTINRGVNDWFGDHRTHVDDYLRFAPSLAYIATLTVPGKKSGSTVVDRVLTTATAHALSMGCSWALKHIVTEQRPDLSDKRSFPSGHTTIAFTGAELLRLEYGNGIGAIGYGVATTVAILRLSNHKHYLNDVIVGAGIGILAARAAYWLLPFERRLLGLEDKAGKGKAMVFSPSYNHQHRAVMFSLAAQF